MSLPEHLHPKTYWEERIALAEQAMVQFLRVIGYHSSPACMNSLNDVMDEWNKLMGDLNDKYPAAHSMRATDGGKNG